MNELYTEKENLNRIIEWDNKIGVEDRCDIISKCMIWWIRLDNDQIAQVAKVNITVDPFPPEGKPHLCGYRFQFFHPNLITDSEKDAYANAIYRAGIWAEKIVNRQIKTNNTESKII